MEDKLLEGTYSRTDSGESQEDLSGSGAPQYVLALDLGTTTLRAHIYDENIRLLGQGSSRVSR